MALFKKRETIVENISYMAIMAAINVVFCLLTTLVPYLLFLLVFFLPLTSAIVCFYCKKRYYPIYAVATIGLCALCTVWNITDALFYVVPSVISGFVFGALIDKKIPTSLTILIVIIIQAGLSYPLFYLVQAIYQIDVIESLFILLNLSDFAYKDHLKNLYIFAMAMVQTGITFLFINQEGERLGVKATKTRFDSMINSIVMIILSIFSILFAFTLKPFTYVPFILLFVLLINEIINLILCKKVWIYISLGVLFLLGIFLTAALYRLIPNPNQFLIFNISIIGTGIIALVNNCLLIRQRTIQ